MLIKRKFEPLAGQWSLPGGTLELGESLEAGVAREMREETGLEVEVGPVVEVFDRILLDTEGRVRYHFVLIDYLCRPIGGRLVAGSDVADAVLADPTTLEHVSDDTEGGLGDRTRARDGAGSVLDEWRDQSLTPSVETCYSGAARAARHAQRPSSRTSRLPR